MNSPPCNETERMLEAMPIEELASIWGALQRQSRRDQTAGACHASLYFDGLPHANPGRAFDLALEVLRSESDKPTVMLLNDKFMMSLLHAHGADLIERIEREARGNARLRWLLGGTLFGSVEPLKQRLLAVADTAAWTADEVAHSTPKQPLRCEAMSVPELARAWVEQHSKSDRDRDDNFSTLLNYESDLREEDPDKAIDLIVAILAIETNPALLALLAAGPLEDIISMTTIDRIEREAKADARFQHLLGGVWYYRASEELKARLDALVGDKRW